MKAPPDRASICARIRRIQDEQNTTFTDAEVLGIICSTLNDRSVPNIEDWEARVVEYAARAIRER